MNAKAIIATLPEKIKEQNENEIFKIYLAKVLRVSGECLAKLSQGSYITKNYEDIINPKPEDNRSPEEIINKIKEKMEEINSAEQVKT